MKFKVQELLDNQEMLRIDLNKLQEETKSSLQKTFQKFQFELDNYARQVTVVKIENKLEEMTSLSTFNSMVSRFEAEFANNEKRLAGMPVNKDLTDAVEQMELYVTKINERNSKKPDCATDRQELTSMITRLESAFKKHDETIKEKSVLIANIQSDLQKRVTLDELREVEKLILILPTQEQVKELHENVDSSLRGFSKDIAIFKDEFESHLAIIRRFDEIISTKASKDALWQLQEKIKRDLEPLMKQMEQKI